MHIGPRALKYTLTALIGLIAATAIAVVVPPFRDAIARGVLATALSVNSLHLKHVDLALDAHGISAHDLSIEDAGGAQVIEAARVDVRYRIGLRGVTISSVSLTAPHVISE